MFLSVCSDNLRIIFNRYFIFFNHCTRFSAKAKARLNEQDKEGPQFSALHGMKSADNSATNLSALLFVNRLKNRAATRRSSNQADYEASSAKVHDLEAATAAAGQNSMAGSNSVKISPEDEVNKEDFGPRPETNLWATQKPKSVFNVRNLCSKYLINNNNKLNLLKFIDVTSFHFFSLTQ